MFENEYLVQVAAVSTLMLLLFAVAVVGYVYVQKRKQNAFYAEKQTLLQLRLEERDRTMDQISRVIHDHICQLLSFAQMNINAAIELKPAEDCRNFLGDANGILTGIGDDLQNVGRLLSSDYLEKRGMFNVLETELEYITATQKMKCHLDIAGTSYKIEPEKELLIYRVIQEAIHNVFKHAKASRLFIAFVYAPDKIMVCIADDGIGLQNYKEDNKGMGITNMKQRAALMNGTLEISSNSYNGFSVTLTCSP